VIRLRRVPARQARYAVRHRPDSYGVIPSGLAARVAANGYLVEPSALSIACATCSPIVGRTCWYVSIVKLTLL
jgi:hypothetical protein